MECRFLINFNPTDPNGKTVCVREQDYPDWPQYAKCLCCLTNLNLIATKNLTALVSLQQPEHATHKTRKN